jgi:ABC-type amino acid transport substrate-binding protein
MIIFLTIFNSDLVGMCGIAVGLIGIIIGYKQLAVSKQSIIKKDCLLEKITTLKEIHIAWFPYAPFIYSDKYNADTPVGLYPYLINEIFGAENIKVNWQQIKIASAIDALQKKDADMIVSIFETTDRVKSAYFTAFTHLVSVGAVVKAKIAEPSSLLEFKKMQIKVGVVQGEIGEELIAALDLPKERITTISNANIFEVIDQLLLPHVDVVILDNVSITNYFKLTSRADVKRIFVKKPIQFCRNGIAVAHNQEKFCKWLNSRVKSILNNEAYQSYEKKEINGYENVVQKI